MINPWCMQPHHLALYNLAWILKYTFGVQTAPAITMSIVSHHQKQTTTAAYEPTTRVVTPKRTAEYSDVEYNTEKPEKNNYEDRQ